MSRRIPARRTLAYERWSIPAVGQGLVLKAESARGPQRALPEDGARVEPLAPESLEQQLVENIRAGRFASGVSASQLEAIVRDAAREGREQGHAEGFARGEQEGFAQGRAEGLAAGRRLVEEQVARLLRLASALQEPIAPQEEALREAMLELVVRIARAVIRTELRLQPESIREVVAEALRALPVGAGAVRVLVSEEDLELLHGFEQQGEQAWRLEADPALDPGDCRIETGESVVEYAVSDRFAQLLEQLIGAGAPQGGSR